jgi:hypothetical protein
MNTINLETLSLGELFALKGEIEINIRKRRMDEYREAVKKVIEAVEQVTKLEPYEEAFYISYDGVVDWEDLLKALERKHE